MNIDVARGISLKKYTGDFSYDYDCSGELILLPSTRIDGPVRVSGTYEIYDDDSVGVTLKIKYLLCGRCSYCLENAQSEVDFTEDILFIPGGKDDGENYSYNGSKIDLTTAVNDAVIFSQPEILLCRQDCKGIEIE